MVDWDAHAKEQLEVLTTTVSQLTGIRVGSLNMSLFMKVLGSSLKVFGEPSRSTRVDY